MGPHFGAPQVEVWILGRDSPISQSIVFLKISRECHFILQSLSILYQPATLQSESAAEIGEVVLCVPELPPIAAKNTTTTLTVKRR